MRLGWGGVLMVLLDRYEVQKIGLSTIQR
jgi:hypothetical protein